MVVLVASIVARAPGGAAKDNGAADDVASNDQSLASRSTGSSQSNQVAQPGGAELDPDLAEPASTQVAEELETEEFEQRFRPGPGRFGGGPRMMRIMQQLDSDDDGKLSKEELADLPRMPEMAPPRLAARHFDEFDRSPRDGLLDAVELGRILREHAPPMGFDNRRPDGPRPPRP